MSAPWIDFRALREKLTMLDVLRRYGVPLKIKGDQATALCPLPRHPDRADGKPRTASLSVNLTRGIFKCFGCQARGNVIDYVCYAEGLDPAEPQHVRQAAVKLADWFDLSSASTDRLASKAAKPRCANTTASPVGRAEGESADGTEQPQFTHDDSADQDNSEVLVNPPLGFMLQNLDPSHSYLLNRGFTAETIEYFGLGYCARGMLKDRIAVPLHDAMGVLVGYAGRIVDDSLIDDEHPKYLLPGRRKANGTTIEFRKSRLLYNGHRIATPLDNLIVCEGFAGAWWLHQCGYVNAVVALMGADCSTEQAALIADGVKPEGRVWALTDADPAGDTGATRLLALVGQTRFVRRVSLPHGQPTDYPADALKRFLWHPCS